MDRQKRALAFNDLRSFIIEKELTTPTNMAEFLDGAGGTLFDVARLVVLYIDGVVPHNTGMQDTYIHFLHVALIFLGNVDPALGDPTKAQTPVLGPFGEALLSAGIIEALVRDLCALSRSSSEATIDGLRKCLNLLTILFITQSGYDALPAALGDGLLRALIMCAQCRYEHEIHDQFKVYLSGCSNRPSSIIASSAHSMRPWTTRKMLLYRCFQEIEYLQNVGRISVGGGRPPRGPSLVRFAQRFGQLAGMRQFAGG
jgi:hypothetical protein